MILCSECYIQQNGKTLMLYRNKKNDMNEGKWLGLGGKFEHGESPEECLLREIKEEAGVILKDYSLRGMVTFDTEDDSEPIYIFIYTATSFIGEIGECNEGELKWIDNDKICDLNLWEGDKLFWKWILEDKGFFSAKFKYNGNKLIKHEVSIY